MEHELPTANDVGQSLVWTNAAGPTFDIDQIASGALPVLDTVTTCAALVVPSRCSGKVIEVGVTEASDAVPVPLKLTEPPNPAGEPLAVNVAESGPDVAGLKTTLMVQLVFGAIEVPQLLVWAKPDPLMTN